ncbi:MAG: nuclear transport factor 2 family protein [Sphingomonadaceae bacterium]|nr:nuclear transport factor 2 family protein [Sphingomonadaceae bacterium]
MQEADYERYLRAFNGRDYDALVAFFTEDVTLEVNGEAMRGRQGIRDFYAMFHELVRETVTLRNFYPDDRAAMANVMIRFEGIGDLTQQMLDERGYGTMTPVPKGADFEIEFFIRYIQNDEGLIERIKCAVFEPLTA